MNVRLRMLLGVVLVPGIFCAGDVFGGENAGAKMAGIVSPGGVLEIKGGRRDLCRFDMGAFDKGWQQLSATALKKDAGGGGKQAFTIKVPNGTMIAGTAAITEENGGLKCLYEFTPANDVELYSLHVSAEFPTNTLAGCRWSGDQKSGICPAESKEATVFSGEVRKFALTGLPGGDALKFAFDVPTPVLLQDNRQWGSQIFSVRIGAPNGAGTLFRKGVAVKVSFLVGAPKGIALEHDGETTIIAGPEWVPLNPALDIEPHSALDFSTLGLQDAPAGKYGRVICRPDGQFAFERRPDKAQRFYGVNLCFSALFLPHDQADKLADRLQRLGYNAIRVHHYEGELISGQRNSTTLNPKKLDQLDYFLAACAKRGIYITTDLFVSRPVSYMDCGMNKPGVIEMDTYKVMVPVVPGAWENWKTFAKAFLTHTNPYTGRRYADDPALAWLSMINEGMFANFMDRVRGIPEWTVEWNKWLARRYPERGELAEAWGKELKGDENPAHGTAGLPTNIWNSGARQTDCLDFFAEKDREVVGRMKAFLSGECGCHALATNSNAWTNYVCSQNGRIVYDYVDDHFYIDHPQFLNTPWRLPSRCGNKSPISNGASGGRDTVFTRLFGKPFTITEYNYAGPGRFRGVGGILTGAMGALQGWGGIWRFAYSHSNENLFEPRPINYFDMASDPLGQASERATLCLYVRGDMKAAPHSVVVAMTEKEAAGLNPMPRLSPSWNWMAWVTRVGTQVVGDARALDRHTAVLGLGDASRKLGGNKAVGLQPYDVKADQLVALLKDKKILDNTNITDPKKNIFQSETGEITIDAPRDMLTLDTARTAGGYAPSGETIATADKRLKITIQDADATVWMSSLDAQPIPSSKHLLVTHLTDLQNTNIRYGEKARQTLLEWGRLPHLVRTGKAVVKLKRADAAMLKVWALATSGKRLAAVATTVADGYLQFTADVSGPDGARMLYEIAAQ